LYVDRTRKYDPNAHEKHPYMACPSPFHGLQNIKLQALLSLGVNSNIWGWKATSIYFITVLVVCCYEYECHWQASFLDFHAVLPSWSQPWKTYCSQWALVECDYMYTLLSSIQHLLINVILSAVFTCIGALGTPSRTGPLVRKYLPGFPNSWSLRRLRQKISSIYCTVICNYPCAAQEQTFTVGLFCITKTVKLSLPDMHC